MSTPVTGLEFRPLTIPDSVDSPDAGDLIEYTRVRNLVLREITGHDDHAMSPEELLPFVQPDPDETRLIRVVVVDGRFVGRVAVNIPLHPGSTTLFWIIELLREYWGRGIGTAAHEFVERAAREHGRTVLQAWAEHPAADGASLTPPTGFGQIPHDHAARFFLRRGYTLEQVERISVLDLTGGLPGVQALLAVAEAASPEYRIVQWQVPTPAEHADGYAWLKSRMNTDAPAAGMTFDEEVWDAARVARHDATSLDGGRLMLVTAAQHIDSGTMAAFNELVIGRDRTAASHQEDTLVLKEHRGHRLGMRVKCAGLLSWRAIAPDSPRMVTYNAEENRPMLDINEAIGFAPLAYEGAWKKVLDA